MQSDNHREAFQALNDAINRAVIGQDHVVRTLLLALLTNGNVLLEGLPGTAKTRSVKSLARCLDASLGRVQFTPDLLPSDVTGNEVYQEVDGRQMLQFQEGPIFNNIVLADEINRSPAKVQAALLEAMEERTVTVAGQSHQLPALFMVLATQNPIEQEGTYPLPEAQMDRFIMKTTVDYPGDAAEESIIRLIRGEEAGVAAEEPRFTQDIVFAAREAVAATTVSPNIDKYIVALIMATRDPARHTDSRLKDWIRVGSSPRATIALDKCSRAAAWLAGRDFVTPDDVRSVVHAVLRHRLILSYDALAESVSADDVIDEILKQVAVA
ncbi:AAA family ATPase [Coraliomargarita akajimensis]|uniref:ATPase associated with various cellular activities AAA_3 n=1 Tax=Coraliomargarita akajimensis (strain DSM 45221 / IAM 15411 / JCM 23193 / KCTC 12865 / 04OKA010-24) TaxID=583355 RepID=D5EJW8_CORAD|nr:MoxR family ATPase [Coraliomargarita akajimensis]ADE54717.1 ATPase associated with various cellular activities AAA_3 [Coraliomargarita akajimensis DSM 45221]